MEEEDKNKKIDYNNLTSTELNELLDEYSKYIDEIEQYDFEYGSGRWASRKHVENIFAHMAYMIGFISNSLKNNPNLDEQQIELMEDILRRGRAMPVEINELLYSKYIDVTCDIHYWHANTRIVLGYLEHLTTLKENIKHVLATPKTKSELVDDYIPTIEWYIDRMNDQRLELYDVKRQYQFVKDMNKDCDNKYCIKYEKVCDREYERLLQVENDLYTRINEMEELIELIEQKASEREPIKIVSYLMDAPFSMGISDFIMKKLEENGQQELMEKMIRKSDFLVQEISLDKLANKTAQVCKRSLQQIKQNVPTKEVAIKKLKLYGEKLQHLKQKLEKEAKSYANAHKDEIIQKAKAIVKNDKSKKITAVIMAIALSGAAGAKLFNKNLSKESNVTSYEELDSKESISETVEDKTANNIGSKIIYEPYVVCAPKLRLRANPSTENSEVLSELQENELVYIYNNSEEILNPYDTHNWRKAIYRFFGSDGNEKLISGYVDADYLAKDIDNIVCMVVPENVDISAVNADEVQYTVHSVSPEIYVDERER